MAASSFSPIRRNMTSFVPASESKRQVLFFPVIGIGNGQFSAPMYRVTDPSASRFKRCISWYFWTNSSRSTLSWPGSREVVSSVGPPKIFAMTCSSLVCTAWKRLRLASAADGNAGWAGVVPQPGRRHRLSTSQSERRESRSAVAVSWFQSPRTSYLRPPPPWNPPPPPWKPPPPWNPPKLDCPRDALLLAIPPWLNPLKALEWLPVTACEAAGARNPSCPPKLRAAAPRSKFVRPPRKALRLTIVPLWEM